MCQVSDDARFFVVVITDTVLLTKLLSLPPKMREELFDLLDQPESPLLDLGADGLLDRLFPVRPTKDRHGRD
jgi:hypothetical protein